ncbi:MAG: rhodanese-like domain-containing protein [Flavobacteriia bacterium]|nr:rhodanese-like domain-containing protein [Flavobacteriia bacterium]
MNLGKFAKIIRMKNTILVLMFFVSILQAFGQKKIDQKTFVSFMKDDNTVVLDVRTPEEFTEGHIQGALNFNYFSDSFVKNVTGKFGKSKILLVYCAAGGRSAEAAKALKKAGFKTVYDLIGGYDSWQD